MTAIMKNFGILILIGACFAGPSLRATAQDAAQSASVKAVAGDWEGNVVSANGQIPLMLHLRADAGGTLTATLDSPSQGANGLACANAKLAGTTLSFDVPIVQGSYSGTVSADGKAVSGTWTQGGNGMPLDFKQTKTGAQAAADESAVKPSAVDGNWKGAISASGTTLHIVFHFRTVPGGTIRCIMDSLDQPGAMGIPCGDVQLAGGQVNLNAAAIRGTYDGKLRPDGVHIDGTWSQGTQLALDLTKQ
jgi:D-alanyl-D-alanine-carboxypeptidase/D-alanyl-D-alanine-endopeptidase